jgi:CRISPR-associated protein Csb1
MSDPVRVTAADFDAWADGEPPPGPVALHIRQRMLPVEGKDGVVFPPTYAAGNNDVPYSITELSDGTKMVQIDSVGAQANRMEPLFKKAKSDRPENPLARLVPQIEIAIGNEKTVSILDAGHRLGDAIVRSSDLAKEAQEAFKLLLDAGDASKIAKLAPTSLVFGAWDSRDTQAKLPRIVQATIRGWDVDVLQRSAQYNPPVDYAALDVFTEEEKQKAEGDSKSRLAQRGFVHVPAVGSHGGVRVRGDIWRDVTVNLVALRQIGGENGRELRRYVLGLALVAASEPQDGFLRQGCLLTLDPDYPAQWHTVERTGQRKPVAFEPGVLRDYAFTVAMRFGVGSDRLARFQKERAKADLPDASAKKRGKPDK